MTGGRFNYRRVVLAGAGPGPGLVSNRAAGCRAGGILLPLPLYGHRAERRTGNRPEALGGLPGFPAAIRIAGAFPVFQKPGALAIEEGFRRIPRQAGSGCESQRS